MKPRNPGRQGGGRALPMAGQGAPITPPGNVDLPQLTPYRYFLRRAQGPYLARGGHAGDAPMRHHAIGFQLLIPHASEGPDDDDELEHQAPAHHPDPDDHIDERGYLKLMVKRAESERNYWLALLKGDESAADGYNRECQRLDAQAGKFKVPHDEDQEPDEDEEYGPVR
jgi:hypothetical protein